MSTGRQQNPLVSRVDALLRRHHEAAHKAEAEVPVLTEVIEADGGAVPGALGTGEGGLADDLERALIAQLAPELDRRLAGLRADLDKELRRAVREAVAHALAARKSAPGGG